jgi:hypothetical protein
VVTTATGITEAAATEAMAITVVATATGITEAVAAKGDRAEMATADQAETAMVMADRLAMFPAPVAPAIAARTLRTFQSRAAALITGNAGYLSQVRIRHP